MGKTTELKEITVVSVTDAASGHVVGESSVGVEVVVEVVVGV